MKYIIFLIIILLSNIIQGITGFAGTILAMPPSLLLIGYNTAKPILNILGLLSGIYVFISNWKYVKWEELKRIVLTMIVGIIVGISLKGYLSNQERLLYKALGIFVILIAVKGLYISKNSIKEEGKGNNIFSYGLLISAGIVHGMFVCGGPLLISYLSKRIKDKISFRVTISTVWIILNTIILFDDFRLNLINRNTVVLLVISIPFLFMGMFLGTKLYKKMSESLFMKITYSLLIISGISLLVK